MKLLHHEALLILSIQVLELCLRGEISIWSLMKTTYEKTSKSTVKKKFKGKMVKLKKERSQIITFPIELQERPELN